MQVQELCAISCAQALDSGALLTPQHEPDVLAVLRVLSDVACGLEVCVWGDGGWLTSCANLAGADRHAGCTCR